MHFRVIRPTVPLKRLAVLRRNALLDAMGFVLPIQEGRGFGSGKKTNSCSVSCPLGSCHTSAHGNVAVQCLCTDDGRPVCRTRREESGPQEASLKALNGPATIYDPAGRLVWTGTLNGRLPNLKGGIYFIRTVSGVRRIVVR